MAEKQSSASDQAAANDSSAEPRRNFVYALGSVVIGTIVGLAPLVVGLVSFLDPLAGPKKKPRWYAQGDGEDDGFIRIASLNALSEQEPPQRFPVIADKQDAWNYIPDEPIGAVYVERLAGDEVRVFNVTCPHAGCSVSCNGNEFHCPCHNSAFDLDGSKLKSASGRNNPSPRPLDALEVDPNRLADKQEIWVKFENFYTGIHEKIPKS